MSRVDGVAKVTGQAKYAAEFQVKNVAYGYIAQSAIAKGAIKSIDRCGSRKTIGRDKDFYASERGENAGERQRFFRFAIGKNRFQRSADCARRRRNVLNRRDLQLV